MKRYLYLALDFLAGVVMLYVMIATINKYLLITWTPSKIVVVIGFLWAFMILVCRFIDQFNKLTLERRIKKEKHKYRRYK